MDNMKQLPKCICPATVLFIYSFIYFLFIFIWRSHRSQKYFTYTTAASIMAGGDHEVTQKSLTL